MESQVALNFSYCTDPKFNLNVVKNKIEEQCDICWLTELKPVRYGEFIVKKYMSNRSLKCHYFCLLSATCIPQRGTESAGITGFLMRDIINSFPEFRDKQCAYCRHRSAPIRCSREGCDRWFHYICGYKNACLTHFHGAHASFCDRHLPDEYRKPPQTKCKECEICFEPLVRATDADYNPVAIVQTCRVGECPPGLMHRECLQQFAYSAGYHFKCPCCLSSKFKEYAEQHGIFIPSRDASWERDPGAFKDLHKRSCTAPDCALATSRSATNVSQLVGCSVCGGQLMHKVCTKLADPRSYLCKACMDETFIKLL